MRYFEEVELGETIETGRRTLEPDEIIAFAEKFDPQPFHTDPEAAKQSFFGGLIASGWHTAAVMMRLQVEAMEVNMAGLGSPGFDDLRWLKPVRPGDTIRVRLTCVEKTPSRSRADIGSCRFKTEVLNQNDEVVMTVTQIGIFPRRPDAAA